MGVLTDYHKHILLTIALNGGNIEDSELQSKLETFPGPFSSYGKDYAKKLILKNIDELKNKGILSVSQENSHKLIYINERGFLEQFRTYSDKEDISFYLIIKDIQMGIADKKIFYIEEADISLPPYLSDILEELQTGYRLFRNAKTPNDYALVIAACGRAVEKIRKKLENKKQPVAETILLGSELFRFLRNKKGAHPEKEATRIEALASLIGVLTLCKLIEEFQLITTPSGTPSGT
jgi:hypothetical protein